MDQTVIDRARGALLGQLVGDAFGAQMEFMSPEEVKDCLLYTSDAADDGEM